jgi:hypothetical protein
MIRSYSDNDGADTIPRPAATSVSVAGASRIPFGRMHMGRRLGSISLAETTARTLSVSSISTQSYGTPLRLKKSRMVYPAEDARFPTRTVWGVTGRVS